MGEGDPNFDFEDNVRFDLGLSLFMLDQYAEASEAFQSVLRIDPGRYQAFIHLGNIKLREGDEAGAIRDFKRALEINPSLEGVLERIVQLEMRSNR